MRPVIALLLISVAACGLSGCAPDDHVLGGAPSASPSITPLPGETSVPPEPVNETVGINCAALISDQAMYEWGSGNFALDPGFTPAAGSSAAEIAADGGLACRWVNLTSQETVDVAVAIPDEDELAAAQQAAGAGTPAPTLGDAYFRSADGTGYLDVFSDGYWLSLQSTWFYEAQDAAGLVEAAIAALPPID